MPVKLYGVQHFGSESGEYTVTTDIVDPLDNTSLASRTGDYTSERSDIMHMLITALKCCSIVLLF